MDTRPSPFNLCVRTVPVYSVGNISEAEMKNYVLAAVALLAITHPSAFSDGTGADRGTKAIATANLQIELPEYDHKNLPGWAEEFSEFLLLTGQQHTDVKTKRTFIKGARKKEVHQRQVKTVMRRSSNLGDFPKRLE